MNLHDVVRKVIEQGDVDRGVLQIRVYHDLDPEDFSLDTSHSPVQKEAKPSGKGKRGRPKLSVVPEQAELPTPSAEGSEARE